MEWFLVGSFILVGGMAYEPPPLGFLKRENCEQVRVATERRMLEHPRIAEGTTRCVSPEELLSGEST